MNIRRVDPFEFGAVVRQWNVPVYNSVDFIELNRDKADAVHYLLMGDRKNRFGIVLGERSETFYSPFSAPFGGFVTDSEQSVELAGDAVCALACYVRSFGKEAEVVLAPVFYDMPMYAKYVSAFLRHGNLMYADLNYHYDLVGDIGVEARMKRNARKNYRQALGHGFRFEILDSGRAEDISRAYAVIKVNRESKGYPLRMTLDDVMRTAPVVDARFAVLTLDGCDVAAVQLHRVTDTVAQVVYWGDAPGYSYLRPMNLLAPEVISFCRDEGFSTLDIGPSSSDGIPSEGLCSFKESLGCIASLKPRFRL